MAKAVLIFRECSQISFPGNVLVMRDIPAGPKSDHSPFPGEHSKTEIIQLKHILYEFSVWNQSTPIIA